MTGLCESGSGGVCVGDPASSGGCLVSSSKTVRGPSVESLHPGATGPFATWMEVIQVIKADVSTRWEKEDLEALNSFVLAFNIPVRSVSDFIGHATGSTKAAAESVAARAGDSRGSSAELRADVARNERWLSDAGGDVALLGRRVRRHLGVPDIGEIPMSALVDARDCRLLRNFAHRGVDLVTDKGFVPTSVSGAYPSERQLYKRVRPAVLSLLAALVRKGQALVLSRDVARALKGSNSIPVHWVPKPSNPLGRLIADASGGDNPPNGRGCRDVAADVFGPIELPRESQVAEFLIAALERYTDPVLSVDDVSGAFSRLWLSSTSAAQSVLEVKLDDGFDAGVVLTSMYFGGSSCPHAWQAVSRVLSQILRESELPNLVYVDDVLRVGERSSALADGESTKTIICNLLTPGSEVAWAAEKALWGMDSLVYIGWRWNLQSRDVALTERTVVRFALRLFKIRGSEKVSVRALQGIASLGARVAGVVPGLRPLAFVVYDKISGVWENVDTKIMCTPLLTAVVEVWLAFLERAWNDGVYWRVPLTRLVQSRACFALQFDGSLTGVGGVHPPLEGPLELRSKSAVVPAFAYSIDARFEGATSGEQNVSELLAITFGLACAVKLNLRDASVHLVGDSRTALAWSRKRIKSAHALRTYLVFFAIVEGARLSIVADTWIASEANVTPDGLSRNQPVSSFPGLRKHRRDVLSPSWISSVLEFVNPMLPLPQSSSGLLVLFHDASVLVSQLL